jgi:subtilisin family serine protease
MRRLRRLVTGIVLTAAVSSAPVLAGTEAFAGPAQGTIQGAGVSGALKDRYIVVLRDNSGDATAVNTQAKSLTHQYGGTVDKSYAKAVHGFSVRTTEAAAKRLAADPAVALVEQDRTVRLAGTQTNPPSWGLDRIDQESLPLNNAYNYPNTASNVTAYIIDTGVRVSHVEFGGRSRSGYDFINNDADADDCNGHGTHVAGTVGGSAYGVAKQVNIVAVRVLDCNGSGSYSAIIAGIDWVTGHAVKPAVANMSLGGSASAALDDAVRRSTAAGVTYAIAAGNSNANACSFSPARTPEAITVGATDSYDARASFSNYGSCVDVFAPGVNITSAYGSGDTATARMNGTSMATPHVTGAAALFLSANPSATPAQVRDALVNGAVSGKVTNAGTGSPNKLLKVTIANTVSTPAPPATVACGALTNNTRANIPDGGTATSTIKVANCTGTASATTKIEVHITHPYRGDLELNLVAPDGAVFHLKTANGRDNVTNLNATYTVNASGHARAGTWTLRMTDVYRGYAGYLTSWTLTL